MQPPGAVVSVREAQPSDPVAWDRLAQSQGNLLQSTLYDAVARFHRQQPVYFEIWSGDALLGGVKLLRWRSRRLGPLAAISNSLSQFGELLRSDAEAPLNATQAGAALEPVVAAYCDANRIVSFKTNGYYGPEAGLLRLSDTASGPAERFNVGWVALDLPLETLWKRMHKEHRRYVRKAGAASLALSEEDDVQVLIQLLRCTYEDNPGKMPEPAFLREFYGVLRSAARLFVARDAGRPLACALVLEWGPFAYYAFGGNQKNSLGAAQFLQWELIKRSRARGSTRYYLGQVAPEADLSNLRFSVGISRFKRRFGISEAPTASVVYVRGTLPFRLWNLLVGLRKRFA
jgi:CelD/BcsL family acetyltransferase involved in cellulose biosynthesis